MGLTLEEYQRGWRTPLRRGEREEGVWYAEGEERGGEACWVRVEREEVEEVEGEGEGKGREEGGRRKRRRVKFVE